MNTFYRISSVIVLISILIIAQLSANEGTEKIVKDLPRLLGSTNEGTEFFMTFHPAREEKDTQAKVKIYITSAYATQVTLSISGREIYMMKTTIPNGVIEFDLPNEKAQCYRKAQANPPVEQKVYKGMAIIITADAPIICYGVMNTGASSEGYLAIPVNALGKNYIVSSYNDPTQDNGNEYLTSYTSIVGVYNKTDVNIKLGGRFSNYTPGDKPLKTGDRASQRLNSGDIWLLGVQGDYCDLTGTTVEASKPVAVISGSYCAYVPLQKASCNYLIEQDLPMHTWGRKYHLTPIINRTKGSVIRIFASVPNTFINRNGIEWSLIKGVGGAEGSGYVERRFVSEGDELTPVTISAINPINITQYNTGTLDDGVENSPFQMALTPVEQYQTSLKWCMPGTQDGAPFHKNYLNLIFKSTADGLIPKDIEFGKVINGVMEWRYLCLMTGDRGLEISDPDVKDSRYYHSLTMKLDSIGVYSLRGKDPMAGYIYGYSDNMNSYGFSASLALNDHNIADTLPPKPSYVIDCEGKVHGSVTDQPEGNDLMRSNLAYLQLNKMESYNYQNLEYDEAQFNPGVTSDMEWSLTPVEYKSDAKAVITFSDRAGNDTTITIEYQPIKFAMDKPLYNFGGNFIDASPKTITCELTNQYASPLVLDSIYLKSNYTNSNFKFAGFTIDNKIYKENGGTLPELTLNAGEKITFDITFDPASIEEDFIDGKNEFIDSIGIKAYWTDNVNKCIYAKHLAEVIGYVQFHDTLAPSVTYKPCCCGHTASGTVTDEPANDPANRSNLASMIINQSKSFNCTDIQYDKDKFIPGTTSSIDWEVSTLDKESDGRAVMVFTDRAGNETEVTVDLIKTKVTTQNKIVDYGLKNLDALPETRTIKFKNESSKAIVVDSISILSSDKTQDLPFSGFIVDVSIYESNGGILPGYVLPPGKELPFEVVFFAKTVKADVESGKLEFQDSVGIKANWNSELNQYCFHEYKTQLIAKVKPVSVEEPNNSFGITDITPNPANTSTVSIKYNLEYDCDVELTLYNSNGMMIKDLLNTYQTAGNQSYSLSIEEFSAGIYFVEFRACGMLEHKSFVIVK